MDQQAAERAAIVNFMGTIFGEAKRLDQDMIQRSSTLQPTSHRAEQALRDYLQQGQPTFIPPAPQEIAGACGTPAEQHYVDTPSTPIQPGQLYVAPPLPPPLPTSVIPTYTPQITPPPNNDLLVEVCRKLDILIGQVERLIMLGNKQSTYSINDTKIYENTVLQNSDVELPGSDPEG